jgi:hypothetical protein
VDCVEVCSRFLIFFSLFTFSLFYSRILL